MNTETTHARPRAFYPDHVGQGPQHGRTPGWDLAGPERRIDGGRTAARMMGWFSLGLGAVEVLAPKRVTRTLGVSSRNAPLVRFYGLREIASGVGVLSERTPAAGMWSRIAGDALDLATLGVALGRSRRRTKVLAAMGLVAGALAADALIARKLSDHRSASSARGN
jgi:hypothetical protein